MESNDKKSEIKNEDQIKEISELKEEITKNKEKTTKNNIESKNNNETDDNKKELFLYGNDINIKKPKYLGNTRVLLYIGDYPLIILTRNSKLY